MGRRIPSRDEILREYQAQSPLGRYKLEPGEYYHGSIESIEGDQIDRFRTPRARGPVQSHNFMTDSLDVARDFADSKGSGPGSVHIVRPTGPVERDNEEESSWKSQHPLDITQTFSYDPAADRKYAHQVWLNHLDRASKEYAERQEHSASLDPLIAAFTRSAEAAGFPNPYHGNSYFGGNPEFSHTWFHGTRGAPEFGERGQHESDSREYAKPPEERLKGSGWTQPNQHLGIHFSPLHEVAHKFAPSVSSTPSAIVHARLDIRNPAHYPTERHLNYAIAHWASQHYPHWHSERANSTLSWSYSDREGTHRDFSQVPDSPYGDKAQSVLTWHPHLPEIIRGFHQHLREQGHHGITYGNMVEGPYCTDATRGGDAAMKYIRKTEDYPTGTAKHISAIVQPEDIHVTRVEHISPWREEPQAHEKTWEQASALDEPDEMRDKILAYHREHGGAYPGRIPHEAAFEDASEQAREDRFDRAHRWVDRHVSPYGQQDHVLYPRKWGPQVNNQRIHGIIEKHNGGAPIDEEHWDHLPLEDVNIRQPIYNHQGDVDAQGVHDYLDSLRGDPYADEHEISEGGDAKFVRHEGKTYLLDGHHRFTRNRLMGKSTMRGRVFDTSRPADRMENCPECSEPDEEGDSLWSMHKQTWDRHHIGAAHPHKTKAEVNYRPANGARRPSRHQAARELRPLRMEPGLYYRSHRKDTPFGPEHASTRNAGEPPHPDLARYWEPKEGYSAFWNPHHVQQYHDEMHWDDPEELRNSRIIAFRGTPVGEGADGEPRVMPHSSKPEESMSWRTFRNRLDITQNGYGRWYEHTWGDGPRGQQVDDGYRHIGEIRPEAAYDWGEGYTTCDQGHEHWGRHGAAGLLIRHRGDDGQTRYLLQQRAEHVHHGGTWSTPGGAMHKGENPVDAGRREAEEELGELPSDLRHSHTVMDSHGGWAYHTVIMDSPKQFMPGGNGETEWESSGHGWFTSDEVKRLRLHPGFKHTWDTVRRSRTDKQAALAARAPLHRGLSLEMVPDEITEAYRAGGHPAVHALIRSQVGKSLGTHWSASEKVARSFAHPLTHEARTVVPSPFYMHVPVVMHGTIAREHHETDPERLRDAAVEGYGWSPGKHYNEQETLVKPGAPVTVHGMEAALPDRPDWPEHLDESRWENEGLKAWESEPHSWHPIGGAGHRQAAAGPVWWHGTPDERTWEHGAAYGIHIGTEEAARQALHARIGRPAEGEWDGTREYGKTLLNRDYGRLEMDPVTREWKHVVDHREPSYPTGNARYSPRPEQHGHGDPVPMDARPNVFPVRIKGPMTNTPDNPHEDFKANGYMRAQLTRGRAKSGYYYTNISEDAGKVSAVVPSAAHLERIQRHEAATYPTEHNRREDSRDLPKLYHGTNWKAGPGDYIEPGHQTHYPEAYEDDEHLEYVHATPSVATAWQHADNAVNEHGGQHHVYEVEHTGPVSWGDEMFPEDFESDDDEHFNGNRMSRHPFRVVRELPYAGEPLPFTRRHREPTVNGVPSPWAMRPHQASLRGEPWIHEMKNRVDALVSAKGHDLDWKFREPPAGLEKSWPYGYTASCRNCEPPKSMRIHVWPIAIRQDQEFTEGDVPAYLKRRCRGQHEASVSGHGMDPFSMATHGLSDEDAQDMRDVIEHIRQRKGPGVPINQRDAEKMARAHRGRDRMEQAGYQLTQSSKETKYPRGVGVELHHNHMLHLVPERHGDETNWYARIDHHEYPMAPKLEYTIRTSDEELPHAVHRFLDDPSREGEMQHQREEGRRIHEEIRRENRHEGYARGVEASQRPSQKTWVGRVWNHVDTLAARNGHELDWVPEGLKTQPAGTWITARCKNCSPPLSGHFLSLPLNDFRTEIPDWWHESVIPPYLKRKCRKTHEPRPGSSGRKGVTGTASVLAARGYVLGPRSGMIALDMPEDVSRSIMHPGGVDDHHITLVYLGSDVSDDRFREACELARKLSETTGPVSLVLRGLDSFEPSESSGGKRPYYVPVHMSPRGYFLRREVQHLNASEFRDWVPHVTLAYSGDDEPAPRTVPPTRVVVPALSVHRGDEIVHFPFRRPA